MASPAADAPMTSMNATGLPLPPAPAPAGLLAGAPLSTWLLTAFVGYALLCQALRFRREKAMRARYGYPDRASLKHMTTEHAQAIIADLYQLEFPQFSVLSLQFGLFKVSGPEAAADAAPRARRGGRGTRRLTRRRRRTGSRASAGCCWRRAT